MADHRRTRSARPLVRLGRNLVLAVGSVACTLGALEAISWLGGRVDFPPDPLVTDDREAWQKNRVYDPLLFWRMRPNLSNDREQLTNSSGLRGPDLPGEKGDEYRILSLGESATYAAKIPYELGYSARVESGLDEVGGRPVRVINAGAPGYTLLQGLAYLEHHGMALEPDAVLLYFGYNDFLPVAFREQRDSMAGAQRAGLTDRQVYEQRRSPAGRLAGFLLRHSNAFRLASSLAGAPGAAPPAVRRGELVRVPEADRWELLQRAATACSEGGIELVIVVPWYRDFAEHAELLRRFARQHDTTLVDLPRLLAALPRPRAEYFRDRVHPTAEGHREIARAIVTALRERGEPGARSPERAYSVQLHVHGSFSEGVGSIDSHSHEARDVGVDAIWWSDHDFRIASHRHVTSFGFDGWEEPVDRGEAWRFRRELWRRPLGPKRLRPPIAAPPGAWAEFVDEEPREGPRSLRLGATSRGDDFEAYRLAFSSPRGLHHRPLAARVTLQVSIMAEELGPDALAFVEVLLSEHESPATGELARYRLRYVCRRGEPRRDGVVYEVPLSCPPGEWSDQQLHLTRDATRGFPEFPGEDNGLITLHFGVETRRGARASARFDRLRIGQTRVGEASYARQRELIESVSALHPGLRQLQGVEISYAGRHLNEFSVGTQLLDYEALLDEFERRNPASTPVDPRSYRRFLTSRAVEAVHARGGLVSLNHVFGTGTVDATPGDRNAVLDALVGERLYGADLLEVGYRDRGGHGLADHLWVWDQLALAGLPAVGIGVSDSHGGSNARWRSAPNNFVSWIHAASPSKRDLIEGLRAGRVFFGDIVLFDGEVELTAPGGVRMGDTLVTSAAKVPVTVSIDGLEAGDRVHVVESGRRAAQHEVEGARFRIVHEVALPADGGGFVRVEVYGREGREKVFSNPIYLRASAEAGMP